VGRAICFVHFSRLLSQRTGMQPGEAPIYRYGLRREVVRRAAARGPVYLVLILGSADHLLIVPYHDVKDMFDAAPVDGIGRCHVQVWGQPGRSRLRSYMPERQQRDADAWLNALAATARDGAPLSR
jgi:hypothetical protein